MTRARALGKGVLAVSALLMGSAQATIVELKFPAAGEVRHAHTIAPGKFLEVCGKLLKDQRVTWSFKADGKTNFNVHYHVGKDVVFPEKSDGIASAQGELRVALDQDYCWMWSNKGSSAVAVEAILQRQ